MKSWFKRAIAGTVILGLAVGFAACGDKAASPASSSADDVMKAAQEKMEAVKSMHYDMTMDMDMSAAGSSMQMDMTMQADYIADPMVMKMDTTIDMGDLGNMQMQMYGVEKDGSYVLYSGMDDGTGTMAWSGTAIDMEELMQYDAQASMDLYLESSADFQEAGTEEINGEEATRYDGVIKEEAMQEVMDASGVMEQFSDLGLDEDTAESMLSGLGNLPISIWVANESGLPVRYEMDMTDLMQSMMSKMMESDEETADASISMDKIAISMTISNFDSVEEIVVPEEVLNAEITDAA